MQKVWTDKFKEQSCFQDWAEITLWYLEARVEFGDGHDGMFITDGRHIALQDPEGMVWFIRLLPAAQ